MPGTHLCSQKTPSGAQRLWNLFLNLGAAGTLAPASVHSTSLANTNVFDDFKPPQMRFQLLTLSARPDS